MIEKCDKCGKIADKFIEFEYNLKLFSLVLCEKSFYRHTYYNAVTIQQEILEENPKNPISFGST